MEEQKQPLPINDDQSPENSVLSKSDGGDSLLPAPPQPHSGYGRGPFYKFIVLICIAFIAFGSYFAYDSVSALEEALSQVRIIESASLWLKHRASICSAHLTRFSLSIHLNVGSPFNQTNVQFVFFCLCNSKYFSCDRYTTQPTKQPNNQTTTRIKNR
jgi:hypothetical protein